MGKLKSEEYLILRDTREKAGYGWTFDKKDDCLGMKLQGLETGDYTIEGLENKFCIERKFCTSEIANNIFEKRFEAELKRMDEFDYPFLICEFNWVDVLLFPINSGLPKSIWHKTKMTNEIMQKTITRYQIQYKTKWIFAGNYGKEAAELLFRQVVKYGN